MSENSGSDSPEAAAGKLPQLSERRAFIRYPRRFDLLWQFLGLTAKDMTSAQTVDVSASGVGLIADREFPADTLLMIRMPTTTNGWNSYLVRVKNCIALGPGQFQIGCSFVKPLNARELQTLLF